jgi:hypothetical protein
MKCQIIDCSKLVFIPYKLNNSLWLNFEWYICVNLKLFAKPFVDPNLVEILNTFEGTKNLLNRKKLWILDYTFLVTPYH